MKKIVSFLACAAPVFLAAKEIQYGSFNDEHHPLEMLCYVSLFFCFAWFWKSLYPKLEGKGIRTFAALLWAASFTLTGFFINNYIGCTQFNSFLYSYPPVSFFEYAKSNLLYNVGIAEYRYPAALLLSFVIFALMPFCISKIGDWSSRIISEAEEEYEEEYAQDSSALETLISCYEAGRISRTAILEFCESMEGSDDDIKQLLKCIDRHNYRCLYDVLFERFGDRLPEETVKKYKERYEAFRHGS